MNFWLAGKGVEGVEKKAPSQKEASKQKSRKAEKQNGETMKWGGGSRESWQGAAC